MKSLEMKTKKKLKVHEIFRENIKKMNQYSKTISVFQTFSVSVLNSYIHKEKVNWLCLGF